TGGRGHRLLYQVGEEVGERPGRALDCLIQALGKPEGERLSLAGLVWWVDRLDKVTQPQLAERHVANIDISKAGWHRMPPSKRKRKDRAVSGHRSRAES